MGTLECARQVKALSVSDADKAKILNGTPLALLGETAAQAKATHG
jgi:hypothetical protein